VMHLRLLAQQAVTRAVRSQSAGGS
jgi:hypothetical protein